MSKIWKEIDKAFCQKQEKLRKECYAMSVKKKTEMIGRSQKKPAKTVEMSKGEPFRGKLGTPLCLGKNEPVRGWSGLPPRRGSGNSLKDRS